MKLDIRACDADVPVPQKVVRNGNIASSAVFENNWVWRQGSSGEITITFDANGAASYMGSQANQVSPPSMLLGWVDAPLSGTFDMDGFNFTFDATCEHRNGCSKSCYGECCPGYCTPGSTANSEGNDYTCFNINDSGSGYYCSSNWTPGGVVIHEFGHALSMGHEHQNFLNGEPIKYDSEGATLNAMMGLLGLSSNDPCVQTYCKKLCLEDGVRPSFCQSGCDPNISIDASCQSKINSARQLADNNILNKYECTDSNCPYSGSLFDPDSVMIYEVPDYVIEPNAQGKRVNPTYENYQFSATDKAELQMRYPLDSNNKPQIRVRFQDGPDWKKYWVKKVVKEMIEPFVGIDFLFDLPVKTPAPTHSPTHSPTEPPTLAPIPNGETRAPTDAPTDAPTLSPTFAPTNKPTASPIFNPTQTPKGNSVQSIFDNLKEWFNDNLALGIFSAIIVTLFFVSIGYSIFG